MDLKVFEFDINSVPELYDDIYLCIGFFDGIHLGHQQIINKALAESSNVGVFTFNTQPSYILGKHASPQVLTSPADKAEILEKMGVKYLFIFNIDRETLSIDKDEFVYRVLMPIGTKKIFCGVDFRFGRGAEGDISVLKRYFQVEAIPLVKEGNAKISSRDIKENISLGFIKTANLLLGRNYTLSGIVVEGRQVGREIGVPTANIELDYDYVLPKEGVYACYVDILGEKKKGLLSYSRQPTFRSLNTPVLEIHVFDFSGNIYGRLVFIELVDFIRLIRPFPSTKELVEQIQKDVEEAKKLLK